MKPSSGQAIPNRRGIESEMPADLGQRVARYVKRLSLVNLTRCHIVRLDGHVVAVEDRGRCRAMWLELSSSIDRVPPFDTGDNVDLCRGAQMTRPWRQALWSCHGRWVDSPAHRLSARSTRAPARPAAPPTPHTHQPLATAPYDQRMSASGAQHHTPSATEEHATSGVAADLRVMLDANSRSARTQH